MEIHNNSNIPFQITISTSQLTISKTINSRERTSSENLFQEINAVVPRYFKLIVEQNKQTILERPFIENNTHVGLVVYNKCGIDTPAAFVSFNEDSSEEAKTPTDEMVRLVSMSLKEISNTNPHFNGSESQKYGLFLCHYGINKFIDTCIMREEQCRNAYKSIFDLEEEDLPNTRYLY